MHEIDEDVSVTTVNRENYARSDLGFYVMPSREIRLASVLVNLCGIKANRLAKWLKVNKAQMSMWLNGKEPLPPARRQEIAEIASFRRNALLDCIEGETGRQYREDRTEYCEFYFDEETGCAVMAILETALEQELDALRELDGAPPRRKGERYFK